MSVMSQGGGFCALHGPFDPPYQECPYCVMDREQRRTFGPPFEAAVPAAGPANPAAAAVEAVPESGGFVRQTVEPEVPQNAPQNAPQSAPQSAAGGNLTEMLPRRIPVEEPEANGVDHTPLLAWLVVKKPAEQRGVVLPVRANQIIGREGEVRWDDPRLSRQHARLTVEPRADAPDGPPVFHLWPFGTTNPVYINGQEIRGATPLVENDEIRLGDTLFVFKVLID